MVNCLNKLKNVILKIKKKKVLCLSGAQTSIKFCKNNCFDEIKKKKTVGIQYDS